MSGSGAFVVLRHETVSGADHWDLMLETDGELATWQLYRWPVDGRGEGDAAKEIFRHRMMYLSYEGPLSGGRGEVRRVDEGRYARQGQAEEAWAVRFSGRVLRGRYVLRRQSGQWWRVQRVE